MLWSHICWFLVVIFSIFLRIRSKKHYIILWRTKRTQLIHIYFWYIFQINLLNSTNSYDDGVGIQASRFNHSCSPNAEFEWDESISASGIRTMSKIYYNQEITVNYRPEEIRSSMKKIMELNFKLYQKWILRKIVFLESLPYTAP